MTSAAIDPFLLVKPAVRQALLDRHKWVFHETSYGAVQNIRMTELRAAAPGDSNVELLELIDRTLGREARRSVCLKPATSSVKGSSFDQQVWLALYGQEMP